METKPRILYLQKILLERTDEENSLSTTQLINILNNMEFINDNSGIREIFACKITPYLVHVCDKIAYLFFVWKVL